MATDLRQRAIAYANSSYKPGTLEHSAAVLAYATGWRNGRAMSRRVERRSAAANSIASKLGVKAWFERKVQR